VRGPPSVYADTGHFSRLLPDIGAISVSNNGNRNGRGLFGIGAGGTVDPLLGARRSEGAMLLAEKSASSIVFSGNWTCAGGSNPNNKKPARNRSENKRLIKDARFHRQVRAARWDCLPKAVDIVPRYGRKACWIWAGVGRVGMGGRSRTQTGPLPNARVLGVNEGALSYCGARDPAAAARLRQKIEQLVRGARRAAAGRGAQTAMSTGRPMTRWSISSARSTNTNVKRFLAPENAGRGVRAVAAGAGSGITGEPAWPQEGRSAQTSAQPAPGVAATPGLARAASGGQASAQPKHGAKASRYRPESVCRGRAGTYYPASSGAWDSLAVKGGASRAKVIRFHVPGAGCGQGPGFSMTRSSSPSLIDPQAGVTNWWFRPWRTSDSCARSAPPEAGKSYWMVFSNKGRLVKRGDHVSVVIGAFHADGLVVD